MKGFVLWVLVCVVVFFSSSAEGGISEDPDVDLARYQSEVASKLTRSRKLKELFNLEDYRPYDPSPSSKASIRHGLYNMALHLCPIFRGLHRLLRAMVVFLR